MPKICPKTPNPFNHYKLANSLMRALSKSLVLLALPNWKLGKKIIPNVSTSNTLANTSRDQYFIYQITDSSTRKLFSQMSNNMKASNRMY